ncbi:MAG: nuclear transport factor 2 family protein [Pseudomonadota bacterium]
MKHLKWVSLFCISLCLLLGSSQMIFAAKAPSQGETLERQMWTDMKAKKWVEVKNKMARNFQSIHQDGARNRNQEFKLIKNLKMGQYILSNFKTTENGSTIIVTYDAAVEETINGKRLSGKPSPRLSVWMLNGKDWQWVVHANLNALK